MRSRSVGPSRLEKSGAPGDAGEGAAKVGFRSCIEPFVVGLEFFPWEVSSCVRDREQRFNTRPADTDAGGSPESSVFVGFHCP